MAKANRKFSQGIANVNIGPLLAVALSIVGAVVILSIVAALAPTFFTSVGDTVTALTNANTNNTVADTVLGVMVIVVAITLALGFVALIFKATRFGGKF